MRRRRTMSRKPAKAQHGSTTKPKRNSAPMAARPSSSTLADLQDQVSALTRELAEAREQQSASSEVLRVISSSPGELEPVFQAMLANATRLCEAKFGLLNLRDGEVFRNVALYNVPEQLQAVRLNEVIRPHHPLLWPARQRQPRREHRPRPRAAHAANHSRRCHQGNRPQCCRAQAANDKSLPLLRRPHGNH